MQEELATIPDDAELFGLAVVLGQNQAWGLMAGRCTAAQAETLLRIREERRYRCCTPTWREFCTEFLKISGAEADRIIRLYKDFGEPYFEVAQLTRISADTFRLIEPSLKDGALHHNGEAIALIPQNCDKVIAAVAEIRAAAPRKTHRVIEPHERIEALDRRCTAILSDFEEILRGEHDGDHWLRFVAIVTRLRSALSRMDLANGQ